MTKAGPFQQWNKPKLDEIQKTSLERAGKDEQPVVPPDLPGPTLLPIGVRTQKVVLRHTLLESAFQDQAEKQVGGRKPSVRRVITQLEQMHPVVVEEAVIERHTRRARLQEVQTKPATLSRAPCQRRIEPGDGGIAGDGRLGFTLPRRCFQPQTGVQAFRQP